MSTLDRFHKDAEGQDLIEYGILLALIALAAIGFIETIGAFVVRTFQTVLDLVS